MSHFGFSRPPVGPSANARWVTGLLGVFLCLSACTSGDGAAADEETGTGDETGTGGKDTGTPSDTPTPPGDGTPPPTDSDPPPPPPPDSGPSTSTTAELAKKLTGKTNFLIGMGNDLSADNDHTKDGAYTLGVKLDLHYVYLVGLLGKGGWPDWNAGGSFVNVVGDPAVKNGVAPMYTLYSMAAAGDGTTSTVTDDGYMKPYWDGAKLMFQRIAVLKVPTVVQLEPDWWGYAERFTKGDVTKMPVHVTKLAPDCAGLPDNISGMAKCLIKLARTYAPNAIVGLHVSQWGGDDDASIVAFYKALGADTADIVALEFLDRDVGCFEAAVDPNCKRTGDVYWDETNTTHPNFHDHLAFAKAIHDGLGRPLLWWQTPFGVPSATKGGTAGHYRDNRVHYIFRHIDEYIAAGGLGVVFGTGAGNQTYITSDGGQFKTAVTSYFAKPWPLP